MTGSKPDSMDQKRDKNLMVRDGEIIASSGKILMSLAQAREIARTMWEVQGLSMPKIAELMGKSTGAIEKWSRVMAWPLKSELKKRGNSNEVKVREMTREKTIQLLADRGMPKERAIDLLIKGMTTPELPPTVIPGGTDVYNNELPDTIITHIDHKTRHKYLHDYFVIDGSIGNSDRDGAEGKGMAVNIQINIPEKR